MISDTKLAEKKNSGLPRRKFRYRLLLSFVLIASLFGVMIIVTGYYAAIKTESYLPNINKDNLSLNLKGTNQIKLESRYYVLVVDENGKVIVKSHDGETIISCMTYFAAYEDGQECLGLDNVTVRRSSDSTVSIMGKGLFNVGVDILLAVYKENPKLDVRVKTHYNLNTTVQREALVAKFDIPITEIYLKNRKIDIKPFDAEYWLNRQGLRFGSGSSSAMIYHTPHISSLQVDTKKNLVFINLEYFLDHPLVEIPYQEDGGGKWKDLSEANYQAGAERENLFSIYFNRLPEVTPRFMMMPNGYLSGFVFTEHADSGNIRTHRAAYFGDESITDINDATGGFAGHKIPVTKSVFYADTAQGCSSGSSIRDDPDKPQFLDFLDQLYATGIYDICLHTPESYNSNRETLDEAIKYMKTRFNMSTWIDHGMYPGKINRESFVCDGLNLESEFFAADIWKKYDTRYFWNTADELMIKPEVSIKEEITNLKWRTVSAELWRRFLFYRKCNGMTSFEAFGELFKGTPASFEPNSLKPFRGSSFPTPLYWQNPTRTLQFYSWVTNYTEDYSNLLTDKAESQVRRTMTEIDLLSSNWGVFINHAYFVRNRKGYDPLSEINGKILINPYFDRILESMAQKRDEGNLNISTIRDLLDYWIMLENITFEYMPAGIVNICNNNDKPIKNLALALRTDANEVRIDDVIPKFRQVGKDAIIWFDIPEKGIVRLQTESGKKE